MAQYFALLLAATDVLLAMFAFAFVARPEIAVHLVGRLLGRDENIDPDDPLHETKRQKMEEWVRRLTIPLVVLVFLWSFFSGAVIGLVRL